MIPKEDQIINKLLSTIYVDSEDPHQLRINMDNVFLILAHWDFVIPRAQYEIALEKIFAEHLPQDLTASPSGKYRVASAMYKLADHMHVSKDMVVKYELGKKIAE